MHTTNRGYQQKEWPTSFDWHSECNELCVQFICYQCSHPFFAWCNCVFIFPQFCSPDWTTECWCVRWTFFLWKFFLLFRKHNGKMQFFVPFWHMNDSICDVYRLYPFSQHRGQYNNTQKQIQLRFRSLQSAPKALKSLVSLSRSLLPLMRWKYPQLDLCVATQKDSLKIHLSDSHSY